MKWPVAIRLSVEARAENRCEYCLIRQEDVAFSHEIDHVISRKHGGTSEFANLALTCYLCNRFKGSDIASIYLRTGELIALFNPREDGWTHHFCIIGAVIEPLTKEASVTSVLLRLNAASRVAERKLLQTLKRYPRGL